MRSMLLDQIEPNRTIWSPWSDHVILKQGQRSCRGPAPKVDLMDGQGETSNIPLTLLLAIDWLESGLNLLDL